MLDSVYPLALLGAPLAPGRWVKQVHMDEAGSSQREHHVVYASVLLDPDKQFRDAERLVAERVAALIPLHMQPGFHFHAKDVFGKWRKQEGWRIEQCVEIVGAWMQIAHELNVPVGLSWLRKNVTPDGKCVTNDEAQMLAFAEAVTLADEYMAEFAPNEVASLIVEDESGIRPKLRHIHRKLMAGGLSQYWNFNERVTHIKNGVMFASKEEAPLLQIADAFAFSFRRYLGGYPGGAALWKAASNIANAEATENLSGFGGGRLLLWRDAPEGTELKVRVAP